MTHLRGLWTACLIPLALACSEAPPEPAGEVAIPSEPEAASVEVRKSPNDPRSYRYLSLDNELGVLLVSDPDADKAAASLTVFRGSYHDPVEYPGLAHFLEHMLFIGTEKYPEVDGYQEFLSRHGGSSNAYTSSDHTNYFFDVQPEHFKGAMDRFAQFFIGPLFDADYVDREKNAVNSEYQLQLKADAWRAAAVQGEALNPAHPDSRFNIGNLETLGDGVRDALLEFFQTRYSSDQMALVALSTESLDELEAWIEPLFGAIENRNLGPAPIDTPLFRDEDLPAVLRYQTVKDGYQVAYGFAVPGFESHYRTKPGQYLSHLLGHEGEGSLFQYLKRQGWIESLAAFPVSVDEGNGVLSVEIGLTAAGYENVDRITDALFDYVAALRESPPEAWRFRELARIAELGFEFQEPSAPDDLVVSVSPRFRRYAPEEVLAAPVLLTRFDADLIASYVGALTPENLLMEISGPDVPTERRERFFDVPYALTRGPAPRAEGASEVALPQPNPYLPENLAVLPDEPAAPRLAVERPGLSLWSDRDTEFDTPRSNLYLSLAVSGGLASARDSALADLYVRVVRDALSEAIYPAVLAGLGYSLATDPSGFELAISGYSEKQRSLLETVLEALTGTAIDPERFAVLRDELLRDLRNERDDRPLTQVSRELGTLLRSGRWPAPARIAALEATAPADLEKWREERASAFHVLGLTHGNVAEGGAETLAAALESQIALGEFPRAQERIEAVSGALRHAVEIDHQDATMLLYLQDPDETLASRARSNLAAALLHQAYFTSLRTEQQLGYAVGVSSMAMRMRGALGFYVQSPVVSAAELERRTQAFVTAQIDALEAMPDADFESYKQGLIATLRERDQNLVDRGRRLWRNLQLGVTSFDFAAQLADEVEKLDKQTLQAFVARIPERLTEDRLLVYSQGKFDEAPTQGEPVDPDAFGDRVSEATLEEG